MQRVTRRAVAGGVALIALLVSGCSSSTSTSAPTSGGAAAGDGSWHPRLSSVERASDDAAIAALKAGTPLPTDQRLPLLLSVLPMPRSVATVTVGNRGTIDPKAFDILATEPCDQAQSEISGGLAAVKLTSVSSGPSTATSLGWLVVSDPTAKTAVSLSFKQLPTVGHGACAIDGLGGTPTRLTVTGSITAAGVSDAFVGCASAPQPQAGFAVTIFGATPGGTAVALNVGGEGAVPGRLKVSASGSGGTLHMTPAHSFAELITLDPEALSSSDPAAVGVTGGTLTVSPGLASGFLDLRLKDGGSVTGSFECGTFPTLP